MGSEADNVKELKACIIQLALYNGIYGRGISIQDVSFRITDYSEEEIRSAAADLADSHSCISVHVDDVIVKDTDDATELLQDIRNEIYS